MVSGVEHVIQGLFWIGDLSSLVAVTAGQKSQYMPRASAEEGSPEEVCPP